MYNSHRQGAGICNRNLRKYSAKLIGETQLDKAKPNYKIEQLCVIMHKKFLINIKTRKKQKTQKNIKKAKFKKSTNLSEFVLEIKKIYFYQLIRSADDQI